jgi:hypothetical protein
MNDVKGPIIVWFNDGYGWSPESFPTKKDAIRTLRYAAGPFAERPVMTRVVDYRVIGNE